MRLRLALVIVLFAPAMLYAQTGFGGFGRSSGRADEPRTVLSVAESRRVFTTTVVGRLHPAQTIEHTATIAGVVRDVPVHVGSAVAVGDALYSIERTDATGYVPVVVRSRIAGTVTQVAITTNSEVRSGAAGVTVIDTSSYIMDALASDKDAFAVTPGITISARTVEGDEVRGRLIARSPEPDYTTGLYTLSFSFDATKATVPGRFVSVDLPVETVRGVFVPQSLLFRRYGDYFIWTVSPDDTLVSKAVVAGRTSGNDVQITSGLSVGDRIISQRRNNERDGAQVTIAAADASSQRTRPGDGGTTAGGSPPTGAFGGGAPPAGDSGGGAPAAGAAGSAPRER